MFLLKKPNMPEPYLFEYAVIRVVPRVEREEFMNVGIILLCSGQKFLDVRYKLDEERLKHFFQELDLAEVNKYLEAIQHISHGNSHGGPIGKLPMPERFRWLTARRSTVVQTSPVHPGLCRDALQTLERLYNVLVL